MSAEDEALLRTMVLDIAKIIDETERRIPPESSASDAGLVSRARAYLTIRDRINGVIAPPKPVEAPKPKPTRWAHKRAKR